jgi:hypothetical protein
MERWNPRLEKTAQERALLKRLTRTRKLFAFLREHRHELFDDAMQLQLESMYRDTGAGRAPLSPALMAMATLLQAYVRASDAEAVEMTVVDLRWQMVLDCLGASEPAFSQGALHDFRQRMIRTEMDRRLLERTAEVARAHGDFDPKKLPKTLRVAIDSAPLEGAGRVEDTINLIAHAARKVVDCVAALLDRTRERVCRDAGIALLLEDSVKKALDVEWSDRDQKAIALNRLVEQITSLQSWIEHQFPQEMKKPPLSDSLAALREVLGQDLEPDPNGGIRIRRGVAEDRRISIEDGEMRHGRKSKSQTIKGYKRHIAIDLDSGAILACDITPANRREDAAVEALSSDIARQKITIGQLHIDRGYIKSDLVDDVVARGGDVLCKPWVPRRSDGLFTKAQFKLDVRTQTITCPAGKRIAFTFGRVATFDPEHCDRCTLRKKCTTAETGRSIRIPERDDELLQIRLRKAIATTSGRGALRQRVEVEHRLAHVVRRQGDRARYRGARRNLFDLRRAAAVHNLENAHLAEAA